MSDIAKRLLEVLTDEPKRADEIMDVTGIANKAALRVYVHELRLAGYPICSRTDNGGGYWLGTDKDKERTIANLQSRKMELIKVIKALENGPIEGQEVISC